MFKKILIGVVFLVLVGVAAVYYVWHKPHPKVENAKGIVITADSLCQVYSKNEKAADSVFLKKAIEVSGAISEIDTNQDGGIMVVLQTSDPMTGVQCTMRDKGATGVKGQKIIIKGFCSGSVLTGVSLTDCVIK
jgi:tRNA_anti-like